MAMMKDFLKKALEHLLPDARSRAAEIETLRADVHEMDRALRELRKELRELRRDAGPGSVANPAPSAPAVTSTEPAPEPETSPHAASPGDRVVVREEDCIGCGTCVEVARDVFAMPPGGKARVLTQDAPRESIQKAVDACPLACIVWEHSH
jgi:ferredoxin